MTCEEIVEQRRLLAKQSHALRQEEYQRDEKNLMIAFLGPMFIFIPYFWLNLSETVDVEYQALADRAHELSNIQTRLACKSV